MLNQHRKYGMVAPAITLLKKGYVDSDAVKALMQFLKKSGAKGVFIAGTTGNAPMLSLNDHKEVIKQYIKYAKDEHLTTFAGIGRDSIEETIDMGKYSIELGADKLVAVTPYYLKKDKKQMYEYYSELLKKLDSEVFIYNIPSLTGNNIEAETVAKLAKENSNLKGIKSTNTDFDQFQKLIYYTDKDFLVFQGYDHLLLPSLELGASGGVCGTMNFTDLSEKLYESYNRNESAKSIKLHKQLSNIYHILEPYEFPAVYNAMFYKLIEGIEIKSEPELFGNIGKSEVDSILKKLNRLP